ncbi:aspartate ammonia-lyase [Sandaracinus amylolyticus]|uniref:Aspartate ammonia-lyase n=1 Tax=Sandaracinus amylolyticus TaxID=927083 RepID=A0A0F6YP40_9BACT|nr:aspartate ammonia-lyase [Sandaracinus amylolyticus]AKF11066.1 Aspartate ammonia-lyase [Sandaracinus amylolyticus]
MSSSQGAFDLSIHTARGVDGAERRTEKDSLGSVDVPASAYWGVHTARALENFAISGRPIADYPDLVHGLACVKQAAARANAEIGALPRERAALIDRAAALIKKGRFLDQFVVDVMQGGAGTSTNMNANEVIANVGLELAGHRLGDYRHLDPLDDVNRSQSTNDVYPTALKIALDSALGRLLREMESLVGAFRERGSVFAGVLKVGRTQLQDAVPMTLGQELEGFAITLADDVANLREIAHHLHEINLGATAVGTGITADPRYASAVRKHLSEITGIELRTATHLVAATSDMGSFMQLSGGLKRFAMKLSKICNDLRLLASGPQCGLGEIRLPPRQAGSSIMPGKVNPVIPEVVNEVAFVVAGADVTVAMACEAGQLQLNAFGPVVAHALLESLKWLTAAVITLRDNCVVGIEANRARLAEQTSSFVGVVTALTPYIGYAAAADLARRALDGEGTIAELVVRAGLMDRADVDVLLTPERLSGLDVSVPRLSRDGRARETGNGGREP